VDVRPEATHYVHGRRDRHVGRTGEGGEGSRRSFVETIGALEYGDRLVERRRLFLTGEWTWGHQFPRTAQLLIGPDRLAVLHW